MALSEIRDVTHELFPIQSPILIKKGKDLCRIIVDYKNDIFLGFFDLSGSLEDMFPIQKIYRIFEGGIAIFFHNSNDMPFVHIIEQDEQGLLTVVNIRGAEPVKLEGTFVPCDNQEYNKLAHLFSDQKVERIPNVV